MIVRVSFAFFKGNTILSFFLVQNTLVSNLLYTSFSDLSFAVWSKPKQTKQIISNYIKLLYLYIYLSLLLLKVSCIGIYSNFVIFV